MRASSLLALARQNVRRNLGSFVLSGVGIVVGIGALVFFLALGAGMKTIVLERIFVVDHLEVVQRSYDVGFLKVGGLGINRKLDDEAVTRLRTVEGVAAVYPKLRFAFKAMAWTAEEFIGRKFYFEMFGDGIEPAQVPELSEGPDAPFRDRSACDAETPCEAGLTCEEGACLGPACDPKAGGGCPPSTHCIAESKRCEPDIPALISPHLVELYNGSVARSFGFPRISGDSIVGLYGTMRMGRSFAGRDTGRKVRERVLRVVGVSPKAITFGATLPISYVRRFNAWYRGKDDDGSYDSVVVQVAANEKVPAVVAAIEDRSGEHGLGFELAPRSKQALQAGLMISVLTLVFSLISLIIVGLSAINIAHTFFMILTERRAELGLLRALGASQRDVRALVLLESSVVGVAGGALGWALGAAATLGVDLASASYLPDFPYKPDTYFSLAPSQLGLALAVAVAFCLLGAWLPARKAARIDPATSLSGR